ncbi:MAG: hypothetical protein FJX42_10875, partial [Alphaproteobacteria bacterium]|nr:hypothetical protein [Alphaproteobacteria bacterium]
AAFARDHVAPRAEGWERDRSFPLETFRAAADAGLVGLMLPREAGGKGLGHAAAARVLEELAAADFAFAFSLWVHNNVCNAIHRHGGGTSIERLLGAMLRCDRIGAFCMTEPAVGSDAAQLTTHAEKRGEGWSISGEKAWVTNAATADVMMVYARVGGIAGWRGIATFLVEASTPGVERLPAYSLLGGNAMGVGGFRFAAVPVPAEALLLSPGDGFKTAMADIDKARMFVAAACLGILRSALRTAIAYGASRKAFNRSILDFQGLQWDLVDVATHLEAAQLLTQNAADKLDCGETATVAAAYAKKFATRAAVTGVSACMAAMGASGLKTDVPLARHLAAAKLAETIDGTTAIQNLVIARSLDLGGRQV